MSDEAKILIGASILGAVFAAVGWWSVTMAIAPF